LEEINIGGTVEQSSLGSESQTLGDRIRSTKDASPSIVGCKQQDILPVSRGVSESRSRDENQEGRATELIVVERDGSPMYISSGSSSPTSNKIKVTRNDDFLECIDLTDSPPIVEKVQAGLVDVMKQEDGPSSSIQAPSIIYPEGTVRPRTKRERRRPKGWEKKRVIEAEKEIIDFGAEASDEPDIRPVRVLLSKLVETQTRPMVQQRFQPPISPLFGRDKNRMKKGAKLRQESSDDRGLRIRMVRSVQV